jgi:hypothetical protein
MSESSYFVCARVKTVDTKGNVVKDNVHDLVIPGPWAIRSNYEYNQFKETVAQKLGASASSITIINLSLLYQSL